MSDKRYVTYEQFGAKGDGVTDDFIAIYNAHVYANENHLPVKAREGANYYLHYSEIDGVVHTIPIKTSTDWTGADFTIDDRDLSTMSGAPTQKMSQAFLFTVLPYEEMYKITDPDILAKVVSDGLNRDTRKVDLGLPYPAMIVPYNYKDRVYKRIGYGSAAGSYMHEVIVLDKDGNVDPETPVMFDYKSLEYIDVIRLDIEPLLIKGGTFTTRASRVNTVYQADDGTWHVGGGYLARGLRVQRSFTTVRGVKHYVTDEPTINEQITDGKITLVASCYSGFFYGSNANNILFEDCVLTGRRCYTRPFYAKEGGTGGTYDLGGNNANKFVFKGCVQSNFWIKIDENDIITAAKEGEEGAVTSLYYLQRGGQTIKLHWGIGGTNFCKNMEYIDCTLSRFDAHSGLYNGKIINSTVNYMAITGNGDFIVENTRWFAEDPGYNSNSVFHLRADYGSTWEGNIKVKNLDAFVYSTAGAYMFMHTYSNWYFGYKVGFPVLTAENMRFFDIATRKPFPEGYEISILKTSLKNEPAMHLPETVNVKPRHAYEDADGDGLVDGTDVPYEADKKYSFPSGIVGESNLNLNPITPPDHITIKGNSQGLTYLVPNTKDYMGVRDGGFFGKTEFVTDGVTYLGTDYVGEDTKTFKFIDMEQCK